MSELSLKDELYLNVGRCLTAWNGIEEQVLYLIEYAHSDEKAQSNGSVGFAYWAVVSFEARLKWCDAVVKFSMRYHTHNELASRWNALKDKLSKKARKRAEIAHGSVVSVHEDAFFKGPRNPEGSTAFVPFYHRKRLDHSMRSVAEHVEGKSVFETTGHLSVEELKARKESFVRLRREVADFQRDWMLKDKETKVRE
jgi:hypothetical protein